MLVNIQALIGWTQGLVSRLNGKELPASSMRTINLMFRMSVPRNRSVGGYWFIFRPERDPDLMGNER